MAEETPAGCATVSNSVLRGCIVETTRNPELRSRWYALQVEVDVAVRDGEPELVLRQAQQDRVVEDAALLVAEQGVPAVGGRRRLPRSKMDGSIYDSEIRCIVITQ